MSLEALAKNLVLAMIVPAALALGGCAGDEGFKPIVEAAGLATTAQEAKPFVRETRPVDPNYIPVGTVVTRTAKRKTVEEFKALESQLEAKRQANDAAGAQARTMGATAAPKPAAATPTN